MILKKLMQENAVVLYEILSSVPFDTAAIYIIFLLVAKVL